MPGLSAVWGLSFPVPGMWEVLPFLCCLVSLAFVWPVPKMWAIVSCLCLCYQVVFVSG